MSIGSRIKQRREELGLTQPELAKLMNVSKGTIGNYETGISYPNEKNFFKLFEILKCDANFLYQDDISKMQPEIFNDQEIQHIKKYRTLDTYGKKMIDCVLDLEFERCKQIYKSASMQSNAQSQSETIQRNDTYRFSEQAIARSSESNYKSVPTEEQYNEFVDLPDDMLGE